MSSADRRRSAGWLLGVLIYVVALLAEFPTLVGAQVLANPRSWHWGAVLGHCLPLLGGILGVVVGRLLKTAEQRRAEWADTRAVWAGALPEGAEPGEWQRPVRLQAREAVVTGIALLVLGVGGGALSAVAAATSGHDRATLWALAVAQVVIAVALIGACSRMVRNGRRLQAQLRVES